MIYLDYSATTPVNKEVLETFVKVSNDFIGNPNSLHKLGIDAKELIDKSTEQIADILKVEKDEIIYTSGSTESNNLAIKGICLKYQKLGKHIITTRYEHSSVYGPISYLENLGFEVDFVESDQNGMVDLNHLKKILRNDTILVSINAINSEIGIIQPIKEIAKIVSENKNTFLHIDATQAIGKIKINCSNIDLISFSAHKFFGIKGIGCLIKKNKIILEPLLHGGKSTTVYRSGTPALPLIVSLSKALRLATENIESKYKKVEEINKYLRQKLNKYDNVYINSNDKCLPYILNISVNNVKPETLLHALEKYEVYISTQTACSSEKEISASVLALTKDEKRASHSVRISLSYLTTKEEIDDFIQIFDKCYNQLSFLR